VGAEQTLKFVGEDWSIISKLLAFLFSTGKALMMMMMMAECQCDA
jgi:hypothetical protein